ncbi:hypothetical protein [Pedobacter sp. NJ-S-72]
MEQAINKLQESVALLSETMMIGFKKSDDNFQLLSRKVELMGQDVQGLTRDVQGLTQNMQLLTQKVDDNFESLNKRIDLLQGNSVSTMESLEKGINDIKSELQKISVVTRYESDYFYLVNPNNGLPN